MGEVMDIAEIGRVYGGTSWGEAAPLTKAEKKAIMRDKKRKRNAQRRRTRRMLAREGKRAA